VFPWLPAMRRNSAWLPAMRRNSVRIQVTTRINHPASPCAPVRGSCDEHVNAPADPAQERGALERYLQHVDCGESGLTMITNGNWITAHGARHGIGIGTTVVAVRDTHRAVGPGLGTQAWQTNPPPPGRRLPEAGGGDRRRSSRQACGRAAGPGFLAALGLAPVALPAGLVADLASLITSVAILKPSTPAGTPQ